MSTTFDLPKLFTMKRLILFMLVLGFVACQKEIEFPKVEHYPSLNLDLQGKVAPTILMELNQAIVYRSLIDDVKLIRIMFKDRDPDNAFVLLRINGKGEIEDGRVVEMDGEYSPKGFNGKIILKDLQGDLIEQRIVWNGYSQKIKVGAKEKLFGSQVDVIKTRPTVFPT